MDSRTTLLKQHIRDVPDFPKPGIVFKDITPLLASPPAFEAAVSALADRYQQKKPTAIVAIESRGFLFGAPLALRLGIPLHVVRKPGKLPWKTISVSYELEYGTDTLQMHADSVGAGDRVVVVDDLLATGGTAAATIALVQKQGAHVVEAAFVVELSFLQGRTKIDPTPTFSLIAY